MIYFGEWVEVEGGGGYMILAHIEFCVLWMGRTNSKLQTSVYDNEACRKARLGVCTHSRLNGYRYGLCTVPYTLSTNTRFISRPLITRIDTTADD